MKMVILHNREWEQQKWETKKKNHEKENQHTHFGIESAHTFRHRYIKIELEFVCMDTIKWNFGINAIFILELIKLIFGQNDRVKKPNVLNCLEVLCVFNLTKSHQSHICAHNFDINIHTIECDGPLNHGDNDSNDAIVVIWPHPNIAAIDRFVYTLPNFLVHFEYLWF